MTTTSIEPCAHGQLYPLDPCTPCDRERGVAPEPAPTRTAIGPKFEARHQSICPGCGFDITPGQVARMVSTRGRPARAHHGGACTREAIR